MARPAHSLRAAARAKSLRREQTVSEANLWGGIARKQAAARFRRQVPMGEWIVDFACFDPKLVIEVDDDSHDWKDETARSEYIESLGFVILRFDNAEIADDVEGAIDTVAGWVEMLRRGLDPRRD